MDFIQFVNLAEMLRPKNLNFGKLKLQNNKEVSYGSMFL